jgi:hypothetical protein
VSEAGWALVDGAWDEALDVASGLLSQAESGHSDYTDGVTYAVRAWIRLARGDDTGADSDSSRAAELARASDAQSQSAAFTIRVAVANAVGNVADANACADEFMRIGPVAVVALCSPFPTLADLAWAFRDIGRERDLEQAILDPSPIQSPWVDAARAIATGDLPAAAETIAGIGNAAATAYARLRVSEALAAAGERERSVAFRPEADEFHRSVGAVRFLEVPAERSAVP